MPGSIQALMSIGFAGSFAGRNIFHTSLRRSGDLLGIPSRGGVPSSDTSLHMARQAIGEKLCTRSLARASGVVHCLIRLGSISEAAISMVPGQRTNSAKISIGPGAASGDRPL